MKINQTSMHIAMRPSHLEALSRAFPRISVLIDPTTPTCLMLAQQAYFSDI